MSREIDFESNILNTVGSMIDIGARAHTGTSGRIYETGEEVSSWRQKFAGGVQRVDHTGKVVEEPKENKGGFPEITDVKGAKRIVGHTIHTHARSNFMSDGVPVKTSGFSPKEMDDLEEILFD